MFFRGHIVSATLVAEAERGNLLIVQIAGRYFTMPGMIKDLRRRIQFQLDAAHCPTRTDAKQPDLGQIKTSQITLQKTLKYSKKIFKENR